MLRDFGKRYRRVFGGSANNRAMLKLLNGGKTLGRLMIRCNEFDIECLCGGSRSGTLLDWRTVKVGAKYWKQIVNLELVSIMVCQSFNKIRFVSASDHCPLSFTGRSVSSF